MVTISITAEAYEASGLCRRAPRGRLGVLGIPASPVLFEPSDRFVVDPRLCFGLCYEFVNVDLFAMRKGNPHVPFRLRFHLDRLEFSFGLRTRHRLTMDRDGQSR